jgi:hypothetical protein
VNLPPPTLQIEFATALEGARGTILRSALGKVVKTLSIADLDSELAAIVPATALATLASKHVRAETLFPTPLVLKSQPSLLGYYRLLYGYSQKQFYAKATGCSVFKAMELKGKLSSKAEAVLSDICLAFASAGTTLLNGVEDHIDKGDLLHELSLMTLGAQYRGGANNRRGAAGIKAVFEVIRGIVEDGIVSAGDVSIEIQNAAGKNVSIAVASDPDIFIKSHLASGKARPIVAIEVKAGEDQSNIHNRIGEAEKSHQKAKGKGVTECWTVINVPQAHMATLAQESPSTDRFFQLLDLTDASGAAYADFRETVRDLVGLS